MMAVKCLTLLKLGILVHLGVTGFVWMQFEFVDASKNSILGETVKDIIDYLLAHAVSFGIINETLNTDALL